MAHMKTLTAAAAFALVVPAAAVLSLAGPASAGGPTGLASSTTSTTAGPGGDPTAVARHPASDTLVARARRIVGEFDSPGEPPAALGDLTGQGHDVRGGPAGGPDSLSAGPWCNVQCITSGIAYQHPSGVELVVETSVPAQILLSAWIDDDGDYVPNPGTYRSASSPGPVTEFSWVPDDLVPGETYYGAVAATDAYGNTSVAWGTFTVPA